MYLFEGCRFYDEDRDIIIPTHFYEFSSRFTLKIRENNGSPLRYKVIVAKGVWFD